MIDLKNPKTLDEKISWLKLYYYKNNELVSQCADKYAVRDYVRACGCGEILNDLYGVYEDVDDIPWDQLPDKFVLKWNMGCGHNIICSSKRDLDIQKSRSLLKKWGKSRYYLPDAELQYKHITPKIVCEKFLETAHGLLPEDYKVFCFNGEAKYVMICIGRETGHPKFYFFDRRWELTPLKEDTKQPPMDLCRRKPNGIDEMFSYAEKLSKPFPFVRADFYLIEGQTIFGELTFTPVGGTDSRRLPETDLMLGEMLNLPNLS